MWKAAFTGRSETGSSSQGKKTRGNGDSSASSTPRKPESDKRRSERSKGIAQEEETSTYSNAPSSRNGTTRGLSESAVKRADDDNDGDWEDEQSGNRSAKKSSTTDGKKRQSRSDRDRSDGKRSTRQDSETSRGKSRASDGEQDRAIPDMGSFEQFPGQYSGGVMGSAGQQTEFMMSGGLPSADNQFGPTRADTFGAAADYYLDEGQSVADQPGFRAKSPNMLVNPDHHLMAPTAEEQPAQDTGHGSAADFYDGKVSPVPFENKPVNPSTQHSSGSSRPSKPSKSSSLGTAAAVGAAVGAAGLAWAAGRKDKPHGEPQSYSRAENTTSSTSYQQQSSRTSNSTSRPSRRPERQNTAPATSGSSSAYYGSQSQQSQSANNTPGKQSSHSNAGLYAAGTAAAVGAAGLAAYEMHEHKQHEQQQSSYAETKAQDGRNPSMPSTPYQPQQGSTITPGADGRMQSQHFHEHKGPMTRLKDGIFNLISSEEDVAKMEMYTEYIGVCKYCFDPRTSPYDAPRVHHYHTSSRKDSFESLRKRRSAERMRRSSKEYLNRTNSNRVDKDNRYYSSDGTKRRKSGEKAGLVGAGIAAAAGTAIAANALSHDRKDFDDTYSVKSGHRESSAARRRSRSSSREHRRKASYGVVGRDGKDEYVTVRTKDGRLEKRKVRRSRSTSKERTHGLEAMAAEAALGGAALAASSSRHGRDDRSSRTRRSRSSSRSNSAGGIFGFFSPSRSKKRRESPTKRRKKQRGFFNFGNGSFSSSDSDLAFGASRTDLALKRKTSMKSVRKRNSDEHIAATVGAIGATAAALAAAQNGRRISTKNGRPELGAKRDPRITYQGEHDDHHHGPPGASDDEWEDELPSDVDDASSVGSDLAFGDHHTGAPSQRRTDDMRQDAAGFGGWGFGEDRKNQPPPPAYQSSTSGTPQQPMQEIDPRPMSEAGSMSGSRPSSMYGSTPTAGRPGPGPIQQPRPVAPIQPTFTQSPPPMDDNDRTRPSRPRRTQSSPTQSHWMEDAALIGAAAIGTAGVIAASGRKGKEQSNVRWGLTEEQERKHEQDQQRESERVDDTRRRADREMAAKDEAARYTREQDVMRARQAENRKAAEAELERQRAEQREAERQAEIFSRREREHQEREEAYNREHARSRQADDQQKRYRDERDQANRNISQAAGPSWGTIGAGAAAAAAGAYALHEYDKRDEAPHEAILASPEHADMVRQLHEFGGEAGSDHFAKTGHFSSTFPQSSVEDQQVAAYDDRYQKDYDDSRDAYIQEIRPSGDGPSQAPDDTDIYDPEYFRRGARSPADYARYMELARKAASKVTDVDELFEDTEAQYSKRSQTQAEFFAPEELLEKNAGTKEKGADPIGDNDVPVYRSADDEAQAVFEREWAVKQSGPIRFAPFGVPKLGLVSPTPPPSAMRKRSSTSPSPLRRTEVVEPEADDDAAKTSSRNRSVTWGSDQTHVYDMPTPEADHERNSYVDQHDTASNSTSTAEAAAAAVAGIAAGAAAVGSGDLDDSTDYDRQQYAEEGKEREGVSSSEIPDSTRNFDAPTAVDDRPQHIPGGFNDDEEVATGIESGESTSKPALDGETQPDDKELVDAETAEDGAGEEEWPQASSGSKNAPKRKLSKKEKRKQEKAAKRSSTSEQKDSSASAATQDEVPAEAPSAAPSARDVSQSSTERRKQGFANVAEAVMTAGGIAAVTAAMSDNRDEESRNEKEGKGKKYRGKDRDAQDVQSSPYDADGLTTQPSSDMPGGWEDDGQAKEAESPQEVIDPFQYQVHDDPPASPKSLKSEPTQDTSMINVHTTRSGSTQATEDDTMSNGYDAQDDPDTASVWSEPGRDGKNRRSSKSKKSSVQSSYSEEPDTYEDARSVAASEPADLYSVSKKSKRRSKGGDDYEETASSSRSQRDSADQSSTKEKRNSVFGSLFGRKSAERSSSRKSEESTSSRKSTRDSKGDAYEDRDRKQRRRRSGSEHGEEDDRRSTGAEDQPTYRSEGRSNDEDYYSASAEYDPVDPSERRNTTGDGLDQSFLGMRVEDMPPLPRSDSVSGQPAQIQQEQDSGIPASAERDTAVTSREHADAFDLIRQDQHESAPLTAFDLIHTDQNNYSQSIGDPTSTFTESTDQRTPQQQREAGFQEFGDYHFSDFPSSSPLSPSQADTSQRRMSVNRPVSATAVPLRFPGHQPLTPSPRVDRIASMGNSMPTTPVTPISGQRTRQNRPGSTEIRPLYLVERNRKPQEIEEALPSLPSSKPSSAASSQVGSDEYEPAAEQFGSPSSRRDLTIDTSHANAYRTEPDYLDSQQTTPRASEPPKPIYAKHARPEPEFYTWEDFERDERMRSAEAGELSEGPSPRPSEYTTPRSQGALSDRDDGLPALPQSPPESSTGGQGPEHLMEAVAGGVAFGGAALLAHSALSGDKEEPHIDHQDAGRSISRAPSYGTSKFLDSEKLMEEGTAVGTPEPIDVAPPAESNELDQFFHAEDKMEEGKMDTDLSPTVSRNIDTDNTMEPTDIVDEAYAEIQGPGTESRSETATRHGDHEAAEPTEPTAEVTEAATEVEHVTPAAQPEPTGLDRDADKDETALDTNAQTTSSPNARPDIGSAFLLTRKQSKGSKKGKNKKGSSRPVSVISSGPSGDVASSAANEASDQDVSSDMPGAFPGEDVQEANSEGRSTASADDTSHAAEKALQASKQSDETSQPNPTVELEEKREIPDQVEQPGITQSSGEGDGMQPEPEAVFEEVPFLSRKKSKKDKKKRRQQTVDESDLLEKQTEATPLTEDSAAQSAKDSATVAQESSVEATTTEQKGVMLPEESQRALEEDDGRSVSFAPSHDQALESQAGASDPQNVDVDMEEPPTSSMEQESKPHDLGGLPETAREESVAESTHIESHDVSMRDADPANTADHASIPSTETAEVPPMEPTEEEPVEEFSWTQSSQKKGKKGKKSKRQSTLTPSGPELPAANEQQGDKDISQEPQENSLAPEPITAEPESTDAHASQAAEDPADFWSFPTAKKKKGKKGKKSAFIPFSEMEESDTTDREVSQPATTTSQGEEQSESVVAPIEGPSGDIEPASEGIEAAREETPSQEGSEQATATEPQITEPVLDSEDQKMSGIVDEGIGRDDEVATEGASRDIGLDSAMEDASVAATPATAIPDETPEIGPTTSKDEVVEEQNDLVQLPVDDIAEGEDADAFWTLKPKKKKKGKKGKSSEATADEPEQQDPKSNLFDTDSQAADMPTQATAADLGDVEDSLPAAGDLDEWALPTKTKKGKKSKKAVAEDPSPEIVENIETLQMKESKEADLDEWAFPTKTKKGKKSKKAVIEDPVPETIENSEALQMEESKEAELDDWALPAKSKKSKKSKKVMLEEPASEIIDTDDVPPMEEARDLDVATLPEKSDVAKDALETDTPDIWDEALSRSSSKKKKKKEAKKMLAEDLAPVAAETNDAPQNEEPMDANIATLPDETSSTKEAPEADAMELWDEAPSRSSSKKKKKEAKKARQSMLLETEAASEENVMDTEATQAPASSETIHEKLAAALDEESMDAPAQLTATNDNSLAIQQRSTEQAEPDESQEIRENHQELIQSSAPKSTEDDKGHDLTQGEDDSRAAGTDTAKDSNIPEAETAEKEDEDMWSGFSTKRSKKEKRKSKKRASETPAPAFEAEPIVSATAPEDPPFGKEEVEVAPEAQPENAVEQASNESMDVDQTPDKPTQDKETSDTVANDSETYPGGKEQFDTDKDLSTTATSSGKQDDSDFAATVAAGLAASNFDSDMILRDPDFARRASPPGIAEADPEEVFAAPSQSKKGKKSKKRTTLNLWDEEPKDEPSPSAAQSAPTDDLDDTLKKTLEGAGFDSTILQGVTSSGDEASKAEAAGDGDISFATSKRKKSKKSKASSRGEDTFAEEPAVQAIERDPEEIKTGNDALFPEEQLPATEDQGLTGLREEAPTPPLDDDKKATSSNLMSNDNELTTSRTQDSSTELMMAGERDLDVDEMDNVYRAFKDKKRNKKKQKGSTGRTAESSESERISEAERTSRSTEPPRLSEGVPSATNLPTTSPRNDDEWDQQRDSTYDSPTKSHLEEAAALAAGGAVAAGIGASLEHSSSRSSRPHKRSDHSLRESSSRHLGLLPGDKRSDQSLRESSSRHLGLLPGDRQHDESSATWSFDNLQDGRKSESPLLGSGEHEIVRDSGYGEAESPLLQRQSTHSGFSQTTGVRAGRSREALQERQSGSHEYSAVESESSWGLGISKNREVDSDRTSQSLHARTPSRETADTPLESTTKHRASYLFQSTPENLRDRSALNSSSPTPSAGPRAGGSAHDNHASEMEGLSPTMSEHSHIPLGTIMEEQQGQKRTIAETGVREPDSTKAIRRSETPTSIRSRERRISAAADEGRDVFEGDQGSKKRAPRQTSVDLRSPSAMSNRSNTSAGQFRAPEELRSYSRASNRSSTPTLRRTSLSGDLRAASRRGDSGSAVGARSSPKTIPFEPPPTPPLNDDEVEEGASRSLEMSDLYQGYGDAEASQSSPTRPPSMRKRQSMHVMELESKVDQLVAENQALQDARRGRSLSSEDGTLQDELNARDIRLREKDNEINQIKTMLESLQEEISRLNEINTGLTEANRGLVDDSNGRYGSLQEQHAYAHEQWQNTNRELQDVRQQHNLVSTDMQQSMETLAEKNTEIRQLREDLDVASEKIRSLQVQIQSSKRDFLVSRDEDYFDGACQKLCQHVQQWVLRFSKMSDDRKCRLSTDLHDDKVEARLDNSILDGSDVDKLLSDRIRRRDVFMSVVMTMVWEYVFTRYLFGMDREQRKKLKDLEKMLDEVGPRRAVAQWRATTLTLLSKRPTFAEQRDRDTDAVANEIFDLLCRLLPPPSGSQQQLVASLLKVVTIAVDLSIEMRCQRAEYIMLPPLQPEYDVNGDLVRQVRFNASLMNERSGTFSSNGELESSGAVVKIVLFPLVVKKGDEFGEGEEEIVVCPAQVLVHNENGRGKRVVRVQSGAMEIDDPRRSQNSLATSTAF